MNAHVSIGETTGWEIRGAATPSFKSAGTALEYNVPNPLKSGSVVCHSEQKDFDTNKD